MENALVHLPIVDEFTEKLFQLLGCKDVGNVENDDLFNEKKNDYI